MKRPGILLRAAAGAWHVPAAVVFLLRRPRLWPLAVVPSIVTVVCLVMGFVAGIFLGPAVVATLAPTRGRVPEWWGLLVGTFLWIGMIGAGLVVGLAVALLLSSPFLELLSRRVEEALGGAPTPGTWGVIESAQSAAYFVAGTPIVFALALIPFLGPALGALWSAHALSFQETGSVLSRRGFDIRGRWAWHRRFLPESLGFGLAGLVTLLAPVANVLLAPLLSPVLAVAGTRLVLELQDAEPEGPFGETPLTGESPPATP